MTCFICGHETICWENDFSFEDFGREGDGIVGCYHCSNCGTEFECYIPCGEQKEE